MPLAKPVGGLAPLYGPHRHYLRSRAGDDFPMMRNPGNCPFEPGIVKERWIFTLPVLSEGRLTSIGGK